MVTTSNRNSNGLVCKNIDKINEYLKLDKEDTVLTLPNELARQNAKLSWQNRSKTNIGDNNEEQNAEDTENDLQDVDNNNEDTDNSNSINNTANSNVDNETELEDVDAKK